MKAILKNIYINIWLSDLTRKSYLVSQVKSSTLVLGRSRAPYLHIFFFQFIRTCATRVVVPVFTEDIWVTS